MADHIDGPLYYETMGKSGPIMAFVHPNPMDQSCWIFQMAQMSTWYRCIAIDLPGYTVNYTYDADGNIAQITYPSGRIVNYSRDSLGHISGVTTKQSSSSSSVTLASSVTYESFGALSSLTYGNGLALSKTFTEDYQPSTIVVQDTSTSTVVLNRSYAFGDAINITGITNNLTSVRSEAYTYTASNRLQEGDGIWGTLTWTYDGVGNRSSEALTSGSTTTNTYNYLSTSHLLSSLTQGSTTVRSFSYDGAGNVTADTRGSTTYNYVYNKRNRLAELTIGSTVTADYTYDGLERLAIRTTSNMTPAGTTHYVYDLASHPITEADGSGNILTEYVWLDDIPLTLVANVDTSPTLYFVHADHLNRPIRMTDGSESVVWDAVYNPFGDVNSITGSASNNLRFPGQYFLIEDGLHYNWYRHYDPTIGRYIQPDPLGLVDGPSIFAYGRGNPTFNTDSTGQIGPLGAIASAALNFGIQVYQNYETNGGDFSAAIKCVNYGHVVIAGLVGFALPGVTTVFKSGFSVLLGGSMYNFGANTILFTIGYRWKIFADQLSDYTFGKPCQCGDSDGPPGSHIY